MGFNCGIVGLPNVGKSTIFNALTSSTGAEAANYPFCTIEPNTGIVAVPDERLQIITNISKSEKIIPTSVEFVDIAGLVKGASEGEGLGNQFLSHIRAVDAIVHVVRCFDDENVTHVEGSVNPKRDVELIETELLLSDLSSVEKRLERVQKTLKTGNKETKLLYDNLLIAKKYLDEGKLLNQLSGSDYEAVRDLDLITSKPVVFVGNVSEDDISGSSPYIASLREVANERNSQIVILSGQVESELSQLSQEEKIEFLSALGLKESGLERLANTAYGILDLITFFTSGPKETRAWTIKSGTNAVDAAGEIHTDISRGFIKAEVISYADFVNCGGEAKSKEKGKLRIEGKTYLMQDGDIVHFRFNV